MALDQAILSTRAHRAHRKVFVVGAGEHHDRDLTGAGLRFRKGLEAVGIRKGEVEQHQVDVACFELLERRSQPADVDQFHAGIGRFRYGLLDQTCVRWIVLQ